MAQLNANTPYISVFVENSFLEDNLSKELTEGYIFGVKSQINRVLGFHIQLCNGAIFWNVPLNVIRHIRKADRMNIDDQQIWNCQSNDIAITKFAFLENQIAEVRLKNDVWIWGWYEFSIDNYEGDPNYINTGYSGFPDEKVYHFIRLSNGRFGCYPNNVLRWHNKDFIKAYDKKNPPKYKPNHAVLNCEAGDFIDDTRNEYFYDIKDNGLNL